MIAGGERRLATRTTFELNLFRRPADRLRRDRCAANELPTAGNDEDGPDDGRGLTQLRELKLNCSLSNRFRRSPAVGEAVYGQPSSRGEKEEGAPHQ